MKFYDFYQSMKRVNDQPETQRREPSVFIEVYKPGVIGGTPCVPVKLLHSGFDWDNGKVLIVPEWQLTELTPEQVADITASVRKGQSWHSFEKYKKHRAEVEGLKAQRDELLAALELANQFIMNGIEFGYIQMPQPDTPDSALTTPDVIRDTIARAKGGDA